MTRAELPRSTAALAGIFALSGVVHLVRPQVYEPMIPDALPQPRAIVYGSGILEIACAAGLVARARWAPITSAALLVAVWPGNWQMALDLQRSTRATPAVKAVAWARVPLQLPMIAAALRGRAVSR